MSKCDEILKKYGIKPQIGASSRTGTAQETKKESVADRIVKKYSPENAANLAKKRSATISGWFDGVLKLSQRVQGNKYAPLNDTLKSEVDSWLSRAGEIDQMITAGKDLYEDPAAVRRDYTEMVKYLEQLKQNLSGGEQQARFQLSYDLLHPSLPSQQGEAGDGKSAALPSLSGVVQNVEQWNYDASLAADPKLAEQHISAAKKKMESKKAEEKAAKDAYDTFMNQAITSAQDTIGGDSKKAEQEANALLEAYQRAAGAARRAEKDYQQANEKYSGMVDYYNKWWYLTEEDGFQIGASKRNYNNPTKQELYDWDTSEMDASIALNGGGYFDEAGNIFDARGNLIRSAEGPVIEDRLGLFLSASEEDIRLAPNTIVANGGAFTDTYANLLKEGSEGNWQELDETEIELYYKIREMQGNEAAYAYLKDTEEILNQRAGNKAAKEIAAIENDAERFLATAMLAVESGLQQWGSGVRQIFADGEIPTSAAVYASAEVQESLDGLAKYAYMAANQVGYMLPSIFVSKFLGLAGAATKVANIAGTVTMSSSAGGNAYGQALKEGYSKERAAAYGTLVAASEGTLQYLIGGITDLGGIGTEKILSKLSAIDNVFLRLSAKGLIQNIDEITEEELQNYLEPVFRSVLFGEEYDLPTLEEQIETAIVTALSTSAMNAKGNAVEAVAEISNWATNKLQQLAQDKVNAEQDALQKLADKMHGVEKQHISMEEFANSESPVWRNVDYSDDATKISIMQDAHNAMVADGSVVKVTNETVESVDQAYPDLRSMKKKERTPILKAAMTKLKSDLRQFLNGFKNQTFEFEVNGKVLDATLYNTGINEVLEKVTKEKANMLYSTGDIFRNARYLYSTQDYAGDPNVYRWNYFYTPVQIGEEIVGVRIAVRDMVKGTDGATPESQIYNWGIKKDASLDGGSHDPKAASSDVSSDASTNSISQTVPGVNGENSSSEGQVVRNSDGATVQIEDVESAGGGKLRVKLTDGSTADISELSFPDVGEQELWRVLAEYSDNAEDARQLLKEYRAGDLQAFEYAKGVEEGFIYGKLNIGTEEMSRRGSYVNLLNPMQKNMAYKYGRYAGEKQAKRQQANVDAVYEQAKSVLKQERRTQKDTYRAVAVDGINVEDMKPSQKEAFQLAEMIAPGIQANIEVYNGGKEWGYYNPRTDVIRLNINANWNKTSMLAFTLGHELAHRAKLGSPTQFKAFADFLVQKYGEQGSSVKAMIAEQLKAAEEHDKTVPENQRLHMTEEQAFEEVVADACQKMLLDTNAGQRLAEFGAQSEQNRDFLHRFAEKLREILKKLREIFKNVQPDSLAAQEFARFDANTKQILADMFVDMSIDAGEKLSTIKAAGLTEKITTEDGGVKRKRQVFDSESKSPYSYSSFVKKPDMRIVQIDGTVPDNRADIVVQAKKNAASVGKVDPKTGNISVYIKDIGVDVFLGRDGLRHSIDRRVSVNAPVVLKAGAILKNSIKINEIRPKKEKATGSYVLIGAARNSGGELFIVRSVVNRFTHNLTSMDVLYAINAKKEPAALLPLSTDKTALGTDSTISIARLLDYVNQYFPDILPEEVFKHYGHTERPKGDLGESAIYKLPVSKDISDRELLVDMFEQRVTSSKEYKALENYRKRIQEMQSIEEKLDRISAEIRRLSFAEGPRDTETLNRLKLQQKQAVNRLNNYDNILLRLEKSGVLRAMIERNRKQITQESYDRARAYYQERNERREADLRQHYQESRRKAVERHDLAQVRQQIRKDVAHLDSLLNKGTKNKNVKLGLQEFVGAALRTAKGVFLNDYNEYDMIRNGLQNTLLPEEKAAFDRCRELLKELDKLRDAQSAQPGADNFHDKWDPEAVLRREDREEALKRELSQNMRILRDGNVFQRERAGTEQATADELLSELLGAYKALENSELEHIRGVYNEALYKQIEKVKNFLSGKAIKDMTSVELKELQKMYRMVSHTVSHANELFGKRWTENVRERGEKAIQQLRTAVSKDMPAFLEKVASFGWSIFSLDTAMEIIGSDVLLEHVQELYDAEDAYQRDLEHARQFAVEQAEKYGRKNWKLDKQVSFAGTEITLGQAMSLYAYSRRKQGQGHLEGDGFTHSKNVRIKKSLFGKMPMQLGYIKNPTQNYKVTREMYAELEKLLTSEQREYVKAMQEYLSKVMGAKGNEVSEQLHGIPLFEETIYFPLKTAKEFSDTALGATTGERKMKNTGFTEAVKKGADNAIVLDDFERVWSEHVNQMSNYHAYVLAMENFNRVYNYRHAVEQEVRDAAGEVYKTELVDTNESVKLDIENRVGSAANAYIVKYMQNLNGGARSDATEALANGLLGNFRKTRVLGSGSVIVQQPSAFLRAMAKLNVQDLAGWKQWREKHQKPPEGLKNEMYRYCPVAGIKKMGGFDPSVGRTARQYLFGEYHDGENPMQRVTGWINEKLGKLPEAMDEVTWTYIWYCSKQQIRRKNPELRVGSKGFCEEAAKLFSQIVRETQVYDSVTVKPLIMQSKNTYLKTLTSFMNEPLKGLNQTIRAWARVKQGKTKARQAVRETAAVFAADLAAGALSAFFYAFRDDDDDETYWEKYLSALTGKAWESLIPLYKLPYIKDVLSLFEGYSSNRSDIALIGELKTGLETIFKESKATTPDEAEKEVWTKLEKGYGYLLNFAGIPGSNLIREIRGIYYTARKTWEKSWVDNTAAGARYALIEGLPLSTEVSRQKQLENAVAEDDMEHLQRVLGAWDNQDTALSNLRTAIKEVWLAGKITDDRAMEYLQELAGHDAEEAQEYITKWEFKKAHPESQMTDAKIIQYADVAKPAGISLEVYTQYVEQTKDLTNDEDEGGQSKQEKVWGVIHSLPISRKQKDALHYASGYKESSLDEAPWN